MRRHIIAAILISCWLMTFTPVIGQEDPSLLTLERIIVGKEFGAQFYGAVQWLADGSGYTKLEDSEETAGGRDIVKYNPATGAREVLVTAAALIPDGGTEPLEIDEYSWSDDGRQLLIFTNTKRVWRQNTRGDYWVLDLQSGNLKKLGGGFEESTLMFAKFSPDGGRVGYVHKNNIYVEDIATGSILQLTSDGSSIIINGTFDWVYEEELDLRDGFRWSPDGKSIAYWQLDASGIGNFYMINNTDSLYPKLIPVQYPKVGTTNSSGRVGVVDAGGGETHWLEFSGDPRMHYIARMEWADSSEELIIQRLNRLQNTNTVFLGDAKTGELKEVFIDRDEAWVEVCDDLVWLDGGSAFTWVSERDGWRHVYLIPRSGGEVKLITPGEYDVISIAAIDSASGWLYFIASPDNAAQRYLYRIPLVGGEPERLTPDDYEGSNAYNISEDAAWAFHSHSRLDTPLTTSLISLPDHEVVRSMVDNAELRATLDGLKRSPVEFLKIDIGDGIELDAWCIKPPNFDPAKRYPLFFFVYGEPAGQTVLDRWAGRNYLWHLMLAQRGYVVMSVDNRGTPAPKGREWRKCIYGQIGILASTDQAAAARALMKRFDWIDPERIGIWGWSGGGSMTLNMMFRHPEIYKTGLAIAFVADQRYYDTIYQERYMGLPEGNPDGFRDGSPITWAHKLEGNLLIVHGTGDDNVHYQNLEALVNELIRHNKRFTMMAYPNRSHGIFEGENTTLHLYSLLTKYLTNNLEPGPK